MSAYAKTVALAVGGGLTFVLVTMACQPGEPGIEPKTPANSPIPTKLDRPDDPVTTPKSPAADAG
jgi:hypothetical protein